MAGILHFYKLLVMPVLLVYGPHFEEQASLSIFPRVELLVMGLAHAQHPTDVKVFSEIFV